MGRSRGPGPIAEQAVMPKYRFSVRDEWGKARSGGIEAADLEAARQRLLLGGFTIDSLQEEGAEEEAPAAPPRLTRSGLYAALGLVGLACLLGLWRWRTGPAGPVRPAPVSLHCRLQGRLEGPPPRALVVEFPEVPLRLERPWSQVSRGSDGYELTVAVELDRLPSYAWVSALGDRPGPALPLARETGDRPERRLWAIQAGQSQLELPVLRRQNQ